jgi:hypothetical protein
MKGEFEETKKEIEDAMVNSIKEMATYIASITADLEDKEEKAANKASRNGKAFKRQWADSTFKIELVEKCVLNFLSAERLIKYYITYVWPMKTWILKRNEKFFIKGRKFLFPGAKPEDVTFFVNLWQIDGVLDADEKNTIWDFWKNLIDITEDWKEHTGWELTEKDDLKFLQINYKEAERLMEEDSDNDD